MSCFNNGCNNGNSCKYRQQFCDLENNLLDRRVYKSSPYPVYPPYPYSNGYLPQVRVFENGCNECRRKDKCEIEDVFKAVTLGNEEVCRKSPIPFNFNAFGDKCFIKHFPHDSNFSIEKDGLYRVVYKLNFTPSDDGMVNLVLRQDGTPINETLIITQAENNEYSTVTFDDILSFNKGAIIDLQLMDNSTVSAITVVNPYIIFELLD